MLKLFPNMVRRPAPEAYVVGQGSVSVARGLFNGRAFQRWREPADTELAADEVRTAMIFNDVLQTLEDSRSPVILTERKDHALLLAERISRFARNVVVLTGGVGRGKDEQLCKGSAMFPRPTNAC
jgi:hypothetical protein